MCKQALRLAGGPRRIPVVGQLAPFVERFREVLTEDGFNRHTVAAHTRLMADLSGWLMERGVLAEQLTVDQIALFLADRRAVGGSALTSARGAVPLLTFLRDREVIPAASVPSPIGPTGQVLAQYCNFLEVERGLAPLSVLRYLGTARLFLAGLPEPLPATLRVLSATQVSEFVLDEVSRRRTWSAKSLVTALRSLLRFLHVAGLAPAGLAAAVPTVAGWGLRSLPRGVGADLVAAMLASCDRSTPMGRRDYAILLMLSRLGLRNGEVCRLGLDDIDWQAGEVLIRGKGNRHDLMPLPVDVGEAVVDYLTDGRPTTGGCRRAFLIARAPFTGLTLSAMGSIVAAAARRVGAGEPVSPHRLRHTIASDLLARRAPLIEVGQLLRHQVESTTVIYAKLDHHALRELVRPWPSAS
jgi:site-specific recombinase XerD